MDTRSFRPLIALAVMGPVIGWSALRLWRFPRLATGIQALGAIGLLIVVVAHLCEGLHLLPQMGWGEPHSAGHYFDLSGAILGLTLVPLGYVLSRRREH